MSSTAPTKIRTRTAAADLRRAQGVALVVLRPAPRGRSRPARRGGRASSRKSAHPFSRTRRLTMSTIGRVDSHGRAPRPRRSGPGSRSRCRCSGSWRPDRRALRAGPLVLAALDEHEVRPGAAPALEQPPEDVSGPVVVTEVQRAVDGVDGRGAAQPGRGQTRGTTPSACGSGRSRTADGGRSARAGRRRRRRTGRTPAGWARPPPTRRREDRQRRPRSRRSTRSRHRAELVGQQQPGRHRRRDHPAAPQRDRDPGVLTHHPLKSCTRRHGWVPA